MQETIFFFYCVIQEVVVFGRAAARRQETEDILSVVAAVHYKHISFRDFLTLFFSAPIKKANVSDFFARN